MEGTKFDTSKLIPKNVKKRGARKFRASLINNVWVGVNAKGDKFPIRIPKSICNQIRYYFSSPLNDYYPTGTPRVHEKIHLDDYEDFGFFIPFREGFNFTGNLTANNRINVDWKDHQLKVKAEYGKYNSKEAKRIARDSKKSL